MLRKLVLALALCSAQAWAAGSSPRIDVIDANAAGASAFVAANNQPIVNLPKIAAPYTTVTNRAQVTNFALDLAPRFGIDRILTQQIVQVQGESGPNGEPVWKPVNDIHDQVRFVGGWSSANDTNGQRAQSSVIGDYFEVSFYGSAFNIVTYNDGTGRSFTATIDNGSSLGTFNPLTATILDGRNYSSNIVVPIWSGAQGFHTIRLTATTAYSALFGYEVINQFSFTASATNGTNTLNTLAFGGSNPPSFNPVTLGLASGQVVTGTNIPAGTTISSVTSSTIVLSQNVSGAITGGVITMPNYITLPPGTSYANGQKLTRSNVGVASYNSNFLGSPSLNGRGGHVLIYQKSDGTIEKAITQTDGAAAYLTSASHANEEVIRTHHWREFGAGRADDFSLMTSSARAAAFTLDDGTTTLVGDSVSSWTSESVLPAGTGNFYTLTFVGTGLDVVATVSAACGGTVSVDGTAVVTDTNFCASKSIVKIASGLPYGTHTVKFARTASYYLGAQQFIVYAPKTPALPTGANALADYFVMADYALNTTYDSGAINSTGVLFKAITREFVYSGSGFSFNPNATTPTPGYTTGYRLDNATVGDYTEYTFFGTGFEVLGAIGGAGTAVVKLKIDGTDYTGAASVTTSGTPLVWTPGTSSISGGSGKVAVTGLTLGKHTIRLTLNSGATWIPQGINVITPIHAPKLNGPFVVQNTLSIGSNAMRDLRQFSPLQGGQQKMVAQASGVNTTGGTSGAGYMPMHDMSTTIKTSGNPVQIAYAATVYSTAVATANQFVAIYVDGALAAMPKLFNPVSTSGYDLVMTDAVCVPMSAGFHKIDVYWSASAGTIQVYQNYRTLSVREQ